MIPKLPLFLIGLLVVGCQQKSEIDKCVEAKVVQFCSQFQDKDFPRGCLKEMNISIGGDYRVECLKAQVGK